MLTNIRSRITAARGPDGLVRQRLSMVLWLAGMNWAAERVMRW